ncbi:MAG: preprotein translocase subunit YajC [Proteobacteria bacterium]|nr:preprotein translocase subunit YajC [Pseudomonadota bacterium]
MFMTLAATPLIAMAATPGGGGSQQGSLLSTMLPLVVIFAIFYFLMIRPQQKQAKRHKEMLSALKKGDRVVTRGGLMGTVYAIADSVVTIEIADNVRARFSRESIAGVENQAS